METRAKALTRPGRFALETCNFTLNIFNYFVSTYFKQNSNVYATIEAHFRCNYCNDTESIKHDPYSLDLQEEQFRTYRACSMKKVSLLSLGFFLINKR